MICETTSVFTYCARMDGRFENPQSLWQEMLYPITRQHWMDPNCKPFGNSTTLVGCSHVPYKIVVSAEHKIFWRQKGSIPGLSCQTVPFFSVVSQVSRHNPQLQSFLRFVHIFVTLSEHRPCCAGSRFYSNNLLHDAYSFGWIVVDICLVSIAN
jgi:hypothetical protein